MGCDLCCGDVGGFYDLQVARADGGWRLVGGLGIGWWGLNGAGQGRPQKKRPPAGAGGRWLLYRSGLDGPMLHYSAVVVETNVDHLPKPLLSAARLTARRR